MGYSEKDIDQLKNQIELYNRTVRIATTLEYPRYWGKVAGEIDLVEIGQGSEEWNKIEGEFKIAQIKRLTRVQNTYLWKKYCQQKLDQQ